MSEKSIQTRILLAIGSLKNVRLWRNNVGVAKHDNGARTRYGLCNGSSDLIGFTRVTVTPDMVGRKVAVFTAIEVKGPRTKVTCEQEAFINLVKKSGGYAGVAKSPEEAESLIGGPRDRLPLASTS